MPTPQAPPELAGLVAKGELPRLEERLPENPRVCPVMEGVGNQSRTTRRTFRDVSGRNGPGKAHAEGSTWRGADSTVRPNMSEHREIDDDAFEWQAYLRTGTKWSHGVPSTTGGIRLYVQHRALNADLPENPSREFSAGSQRVAAKLETPDESAATLEFAAPNPQCVRPDALHSRVPGPQYPEPSDAHTEYAPDNANGLLEVAGHTESSLPRPG